MSNKDKFLQLKTKMQDQALNNDNIELFSQLSDLTSLMLEINMDGYTKGVEQVKEIYKVK